jgi:hypothetical protein
MKRLAPALAALVLVLFAVFILSGDSAIVTPEKTESATPVVAQPEVDSMTAATQELQVMLEVVSNSVPVSTWEPEQPVAELIKADTCTAPEDDIWQISWAGAINGSRSDFDANLENVFANSDYDLRKLNANQYVILGESGFNAGVNWNEESGYIELEFASACFEDIEPTS